MDDLLRAYRVELDHERARADKYWERLRVANERIGELQAEVEYLRRKRAS